MASIFRTLLLSSFLFFSLSAGAQSYYTCQLSELEADSDYLKVTGTATIHRSVDRKFTMNIDARLSVQDEEGSEVEDVVAVGLALEDIHASSEEVLMSGEWSVLSRYFGNEQPKGAHIFSTPGFEEDGAGYAMVVVHGEQNTKKSVVYIGWLIAICQ